VNIVTSIVCTIIKPPIRTRQRPTTKHSVLAVIITDANSSRQRLDTLTDRFQQTHRRSDRPNDHITDNTLRIERNQPRLQTCKRNRQIRDHHGHRTLRPAKTPTGIRIQTRRNIHRNNTTPLAAKPVDRQHGVAQTIIQWPTSTGPQNRIHHNIRNPTRTARNKPLRNPTDQSPGLASPLCHQPHRTGNPEL